MAKAPVPIDKAELDDMARGVADIRWLAGRLRCAMMLADRIDDVTRLKTDAELLTGQIAGLRKSAADLLKEEDGIKADIARLTARRDEVKSEVATIAAELRPLERQKADLLTSIAESTAQSQQVEEALTVKRNDLAEVEGRYETLRAKFRD